jgi:hypothetical protein
MKTVHLDFVSGYQPGGVRYSFEPLLSFRIV